MHLAALVRDFIIYIDHECFEHPDELQRFLGDSSQYLRRYNRKVVVNTDYVSGAQKTLADESKLHASMQRIENSGRLERLDCEDIETAVSELLEKDNVLLITQNRQLADAVFGAPRFQELTQLYIKTIAETAEMQDFPGIRPKKSVPLGNSPMQASTVSTAFTAASITPVWPTMSQLAKLQTIKSYCSDCSASSTFSQTFSALICGIRS